VLFGALKDRAAREMLKRTGCRRCGDVEENIVAYRNFNQSIHCRYDQLEMANTLRETVKVHRKSIWKVCVRFLNVSIKLKSKTRAS